MSARSLGWGAAASLWLAVLVAVPASGRAATVPRPQLQASSAALYAPATGQTLFDDQDERRSAIASTTKLMTALIVLQHVHRLGTVFTDPDFYPAIEDSQLGITPGTRMTVRDLLIAMMLPSADDAAYDLAYNVAGGSIPRFVAMMNVEARKLGLTHTHYATPIGLDTPGNYSTASDLVRLAAYDLTHSRFFARIVDLPSATLATGPVRHVTNLNTLVGQIPWITGVKTGHTADAGYVLVASGHRDGMTLISAVLGTDSESARTSESLALLEYGFADFSLRTPIRAGQLEARPTVKDSPGKHAIVVAARTVRRIFARDAQVAVTVSVPRRLTGPLPSGSVVGSATVHDGDRTVATVPLVLQRALPAVSGLTLAVRFVTKPLTLLIILVAMAVLVALVSSSRRRRRRRRRPRRDLETA